MPGKPNPERNKKIRELWNCGHYTQKQLGAMFGIGQNHVSRIVRHVENARVDVPKTPRRFHVMWNGKEKTVMGG